mgnify:CR=1 FL=1
MRPRTVPARPFMTARWENLLVVTYGVPDDVVGRLLPRGLELDPLGGEARVIFVAFVFARTWGYVLELPAYAHFPVINRSRAHTS